MDWHLGWYILPTAFLLDLVLGDPLTWPHPVRWMGKAIEVLETPFRKLPLDLTINGGLFTAALVCGTWLLTWSLLVIAAGIHPVIRNVLEIVLIYYAISASSLQSAAMEIYQCLQQHNIPIAREKVAQIVGRDVGSYMEDDIARATVETVAENLVDGVISPLFFAVIGGAPLAMAYKMVNTLDSMVGYKNEKYEVFGKASARCDDIFNYIPARLAVPIVALASQIMSGNGLRSLQTAIREGANHSSPNAGYPEAAFAGALAVRLNGPNYYNGKLVEKPYLGVRFGSTTADHIKKACDLMMLSSLVGLGILWSAKAFWPTII
jgi:adenosylcobinamide-phosphate synthase